ncbi:hypothetical protein F441_22387 [Phytophthora nicotianae CJ01A1]|uniref:Uncharacterized protein n=2 Tax=Phytophthora nicotianae TaxID=4792 RepID=W2FSI3_PHYNI|nr:hypothetical protein L915_19990 [Phytophthora nicotianae]ETL26471.1 hypothetical protein L916_19870 [Phytophthora nicotianae]ETL79695.1 hypothetical protein L917_19729 [Phytophthora nicotianae]ETM32932.1 hypothetical protein L914_19772 [Phytophthora nicotianae]ETP00187.1 hypothetical protein F441_22387 [Phytophthora nicotianae CJ01A1]
MHALAIATKVDQVCPGKLDKNLKKQGLKNDVVITINPKLWKSRRRLRLWLDRILRMKAKCKWWIEGRKWF